MTVKVYAPAMSSLPGDAMALRPSQHILVFVFSGELQVLPQWLHGMSILLLDADSPPCPCPIPSVISLLLVAQSLLGTTHSPALHSIRLWQGFWV